MFGHTEATEWKRQNKNQLVCYIIVGINQKIKIVYTLANYILLID